MCGYVCLCIEYQSNNEIIVKTNKTEVTYAPTPIQIDKFTDVYHTFLYLHLFIIYIIAILSMTKENQLEPFVRHRCSRDNKYTIIIIIIIRII